MEGGEGGTHIYAIRDPENADEEDLAEEATLVAPATRQEQCPPREFSIPPPMHVLDGADVFVNSVMASNPRQEGTWILNKVIGCRGVVFWCG